MLLCHQISALRSIEDAHFPPLFKTPQHSTTDTEKTKPEVWTIEHSAHYGPEVPWIAESRITGLHGAAGLSSVTKKEKGVCSEITLALLAVALICSSCASSLGAASLRYHHWISREKGEAPTARKAHGISMSSPSSTLTSLGTSVNVANAGRGETRGNG